jgi:hypothetical protein
MIGVLPDARTTPIGVDVSTAEYKTWLDVVRIVNSISLLVLSMKVLVPTSSTTPSFPALRNSIPRTPLANVRTIE